MHNLDYRTAIYPEPVFVCPPCFDVLRRMRWFYIYLFSQIEMRQNVTSIKRMQRDTKWFDDLVGRKQWPVISYKQNSNKISSFREQTERLNSKFADC